MREILNFKRLFSTTLFNINIAKVKIETGKVVDHYIIDPLRNSVAGVVVKKKKVVLVKTKRVIWDKPRWELPGGWMKEGEIALSAIRRKVEEETGFEVKGIKRVGSTITDLGLSTKEMFYFYVEVGDRIFSFNQNIVEKVSLFSYEQVKKLINTGEIVDQRTLTALMLARNKDLIK